MAPNLGSSCTQQRVFDSKGYKCYYPPSKKKIVLANVTFKESESYFTVLSLRGEFHQGR